jgi:signal transduction histidine kinase
MLRTLRSRLLLSYVATIGTVLFLVAVALLVASIAPSTTRLRLLPAFQRMRTISIGMVRELTMLAQQGAGRETLEQTLAETAQAYDVRVLLVGLGRHTVLYDSKKEDSWVGTQLRQVEEFTWLLPDSNTFPSGRYRAADGSRWLVQAASLGQPGQVRGFLLLAVPETSGLAFFREAFVPTLWRAGLVAFALSIILAFIISRSVAEPLGDMATAAEEVARGNYEQRLSLSGPEEVQRVARSFNSMAARVKSTQQAQRDFLTNVSHDLKTPLTAIQGWSQALRDGTAVNGAQQERAIEVIHEESERMARMVQQLLTLARIDSGELEQEQEWVDINQIVADVQRNLAREAEQKRVELTLQEAIAPPLWADRDQLMQAFTNLVDNALTHTPAGGAVTIDVQTPTSTQIQVAVHDSGPGISVGEQARIFERFYQVEKSRAGTGARTGYGLGLAIARDLIAAHGGTITVASEPDSGATFTVHLPVPGQMAEQV